MLSHPKRVTYQYANDENNDYLVPLQYEQTIISSKMPISTPPMWISVLTSIYFPLSLLLYLGIPISQLIIGLIYIGQCPVQQLIVVWMIVNGLTGIILVIIGNLLHILMPKQQSTFSSSPLRIRILLPMFVLLLLFIIGWFFAGQVFVFEVKLRVEYFDSSLPEYCHPTLYKSAYILIFIEYLIVFFDVILNIISCITPPEPPKRRGGKLKKDKRTTRS